MTNNSLRLDRIIKEEWRRELKMTTHNLIDPDQPDRKMTITIKDGQVLDIGEVQMDKQPTEELKIGDSVKLTKEYVKHFAYPYSELAKLRYFTVLSMPDNYGVVRLRREDLASHRVEHYHESFLTLIEQEEK